MQQAKRVFKWGLALSLIGALAWVGTAALWGHDARHQADDETIEVGGQA